MIGAAVCIAVFVLVFLCGRRSLGLGICALLTYGYFYGILRANILNPYLYVSFDAAALGLYAAAWFTPITPRLHAQTQTARGWMIGLIAWPCVLLFFPFQHPLVQLVGLRHIVVFLPCLLVGARLQAADLERIARWLVVLNLVAFGFALFEYFYGIERLFPLNPVTELMYRSYDISTSKGRFHRIPATFPSAHSYASAMLLTVPFLFNPILDRSRSGLERLLMAAACLASMLGIFLSGVRSPVVQLFASFLLLVLLAHFLVRARYPVGFALAVLGAVLIYLVLREERMQRIATLTDTEMVERRMESSLSFSLLEAILAYPLGAGLGSAFGSSMPFFVQHLAPTQIGAENEYARIAIEQGVVGLGLWLIFLFSFLRHRLPALGAGWQIGLLHMKIMAFIMWATAFLGTGLLQGIPSSAVLLVQMGLLLRDPVPMTRRLTGQAAPGSEGNAA